MILNDGRIKNYLGDGTLKIDPLDEVHIQPASVDLTLSPDFVLFSEINEPLDLAIPPYAQFNPMYRTQQRDGIVLEPHQFMLGSTAERIAVPDFLVGRIEGKSSLGRLGLLIHATAGFCDPGFEGTITLELYNLSYRPIILRPGLAICQISFQELVEPAEKPYGHPDLHSKYQHQTVPTESRYEG